MDGWVKIDGNQPIKYVNRQNIVSINDVGGGVVATMWNGDTVRMKELPPPTARNYIQDGLVAMWDGIENAGWGIHDPNATVWKDLIGNHDLRVDKAAKWGDDCLSANTEINGIAWRDESLETSMQTVECGWQRLSTTSTRIIFSCGGNTNGSKRGFIVHANNNHIRGVAYWGDGPVGIAPSKTAKLTASFTFPDKSGYIPSHAYLNGKVSAAKSHDTWSGRSALGFSRYSNNGYYFTGNLYFARIYSRALTAEEIEHNHKIDKKRFGLT